jgi:TrmH family RNA methyltransferase
MKTISSRQHPIVRTFRALARTPDPTGARLLLDGVHLVREARAAGAEIEIAAIAASRAGRTGEDAEVARRLHAEGTRVVSASEQTLAAMSPVRAPSGIVAIARRRPADADQIFTRPDAFVLATLDIQDPGNLGSLLRAAEAGGATGVLVCGASANPFSWKAVRGSMGSILRLPVVAGLSADDALRIIRTHGARMIAAAARGGRDPDDVDWRGRVGLLMGGEGPGLSEAILAVADERVTIPMVAPVESLNVAVAAAILVYTARRQRVPLDKARGA